MATQCTQIPTIICPCQSSLRQTLPSWGSTFFFLALTHALPFFSCLNTTTCSSGTFLPRSHMMLLSWLEVLWRHFSWPHWPKLLLPLPHWHPPCHRLAHILQGLFCIIIWSFIVFHALCLCPPPPRPPYWSMNSRRAETFLLLFTSVCPVSAHNRQWMKIT